MDGMRFSTWRDPKGRSKLTMRSLACCFKNVEGMHLGLIDSDDADLSDDE
jgi:hypothetical protein